MGDVSVGDIVHLRSGSPDLTVTSLDDGTARVSWFVDDYAQEDSYPVEALMLKHAPATVVQLKRG